jgi:hypothetical protein
MVALETRYHGATNFRGSRISCSRMDRYEGRQPRVYVSFDYALSGEELHFEAVKQFCAKFKWNGKLCCGGTDRGYVWVFVPARCMNDADASYPQIYYLPHVKEEHNRC